MNLRKIEPNEVVATWPKARAFIMRAVRYEDPEYSEMDVVNLLVAGERTLFVIEDDGIVGAVVAGIISYRLTKRCRIHWCGGDGMPDWVHLIDVIEEWAMKHGCTSVRISGRKGWERVFPDYDHAGVILVKRLSHENAH